LISGSLDDVKARVLAAAQRFLPPLSADGTESVRAAT
jgi:hypothetical protein